MSPSKFPIGSDDDNSKRRSSSSRGGRIFFGGDSSLMSSSSSSSSLSLNLFPPDEQQQRFLVLSSPKEVLSSIYNDMTMRIIIEFAICLGLFHFGIRGPTLFVLPVFMGGMMNMRDIPYQLTKAGDVLLDFTLNNEYVPKSDVIFPSDRLWLISLWIPLITVLVLGSFLPLAPVRHPHPTTSSFVENNGALSNAHAGSCVILVGIGISELITQTTKFYVGRLRPNFYGMCGFDTSTLRCTNDSDMIMESRMSFPSGHSSLCFAGSVCLVLFFLGRCGLGRTSFVPIRGGGRVGNVVPMSSRWGRIAFVMSFSPLLLSLWCATSRLVDNWHHPSDILAGSIVGTVSAFVSYHIWFPHVLSVHAGIPLSVVSKAIYDDEGWSGDAGTIHLLGEKSFSLPTFNVA